MPVKKLTPQDFEAQLRALDNPYALFEAELLESHDYNQQSLKLLNDLPTARKVDDILDEQDPHSRISQVWEDTRLDSMSGQGPLLIAFREDSTFIEQYIGLWSRWHVGVFVTATEETELLSHLKSILFVNLPTDKGIRFRLQEPRKLRSILIAFDDPERASSLLGPITQLHWIEYCGADVHYYHYNNETAHPVPASSDEFSFSIDEIQRIDQADLAWFKRSVLSDLWHDLQHSPEHAKHLLRYSELEIKDTLEEGYNFAIKYGITDQSGLRFFLLNHLYYPSVMNSDAAKRITFNKDWLASRKITELSALLANHKKVTI